jgi:hypothetical protein
MIRPAANALASANTLANALDLARTLARDLDHAQFPAGTLARVNALAHTLSDARALVVAGDRDHAESLTLALARAKALASALTNANANANANANDPHRALARELARDLARELFDLDATAHWAKAVIAGSGRSVSWRLVALAVRLLPVSQRHRYRAEFGVELVELPCRERLGYARRVLADAWELRRALVEAARSADGAVARQTGR